LVPAVAPPRTTRPEPGQVVASLLALLGGLVAQLGTALLVSLDVRQQPGSMAVPYLRKSGEVRTCRFGSPQSPKNKTGPAAGPGFRRFMPRLGARESLGA
jgi:hypothetical protein